MTKNKNKDYIIELPLDYGKTVETKEVIIQENFMHNTGKYEFKDLGVELGKKAYDKELKPNFMFYLITDIETYSNVNTKKLNNIIDEIVSGFVYSYRNKLKNNEYEKFRTNFKNVHKKAYENKDITELYKLSDESMLGKWFSINIVEEIKPLFNLNPKNDLFKIEKNMYESIIEKLKRDFSKMIKNTKP